MASSISPDGRSDTRKFCSGWAVFLALLIAPLCVIAAISAQFAFETPWSERPVVAYVALAIVCGLSAPAMVLLFQQDPPGTRAVIGLFLVGLALRGIFFPTTPILEDDWHRYLWDGAIVAQGGNPYQFAPAEGLARDAFGALHPPTDNRALASIRALGESDPRFPERVNYPYLTTIYPPVAQSAFAVAATIAPFSLFAWRAVVAAADLITFALLSAALAAYGRPRFWALLYWLNPIVIVQSFSAAHMDVLLGPFLIGALLLSRRGASLLSGAALAGAIGVKIWPLILVPIFMRAAYKRGPRSALLFACAVLGLGAVVLLPMLADLGEGRSGLAAYTESWARNAFLFSILEGVLGVFTSDSGLIARLTVGAILTAVSICIAFRRSDAGARLPGVALALTAGLFFLSPTGYPWYAIWLIVLTPFAPTYGIASLSATLPLYALRFPNALTDGEVGPTILALQFLPPLALLLWEARKWSHR